MLGLLWARLGSFSSLLPRGRGALLTVYPSPPLVHKRTRWSLSPASLSDHFRPLQTTLDHFIPLHNATSDHFRPLFALISTPPDDLEWKKPCFFYEFTFSLFQSSEVLLETKWCPRASPRRLQSPKNLPNKSKIAPHRLDSALQNHTYISQMAPKARK